MKEIQKVVQKLSREQESAAGGGGSGGGGVRTGTKTKSPPAYRGDLKRKYLLKIFFKHKINSSWPETIFLVFP